MRIATFNVQNLRLRGGPGARTFDGAQDGHEAAKPAKAGRFGNGDDEIDLARRDRVLTARVIADAMADVVALQEIFDQATLDAFHETFLAPIGAVYPHRICREGNDGRSQDVALLSRLPIGEVQSHAHLTFADVNTAPPSGMAESTRLFRRDCLAAHCGPLWIFACHFKVPEADRARGSALRRSEAIAVRHIICERFADPAAAAWAILGDFNAHDAEGEADLSCLLDGFAVDLSERVPAGRRWTFHHPDYVPVTAPDRILLSPALARQFPDARIEVMRQGMPRRARRYAGPHYEDVGESRPRASDHALVFVDLPF